MRLEAGTKLGRYEIRSLIGVGGMGEVYRASDPKIERDVAIKVLPADFSADKDRVARFEQEARAAGALNHPNILAVYDIDSGDGNLFVVSELLEGEELRDRLGDGPLSPRKVVDYALQIAAGLSAAHERGVIHRDLKPENIFITNDDRVKILDFGLAKLRAPKSDTHGSEDATRKAITNPGVVMGTVGYMSPEQVRGHAVDHRSDIFSFGLILYEMITGRRAFQHETMAETMSAILKDEPPEMTESNPNISPAIERIIRRCLEKKPERRFQTASDLGFALEALSDATTSSGRNLTTVIDRIDDKPEPAAKRRRVVLPWIVAGVLGLALVALCAVQYVNRATPQPRAMRLALAIPPELSFNDVSGDYAVISPDGQKIAFSAREADGKSRLYIRDIDSTEAKALPGADNPLEPFWSPDSKSIAYGSNGKLKRSDIASGGNPQILCDAPRIVGGSWGKDGVIVLVPDWLQTLQQIPARGGELKPVVMNNPDGADHVEAHRRVSFLPDGRRFVFVRNLKGIWAGSLDSPEIKEILPIPRNAHVIYAPQGYLIYYDNGMLVAQAFDEKGLVLKGDPIPIVSGQTNPTERAFSVSDDGTLLWQAQWERDTQLAWFDREGKQTGVIEASARAAVGRDPQISPDGKRLAIKRGNALWAIDLEKGTEQRITTTFAQSPVWSPDGTRLAFSSSGVNVMNANGSGEPELLARGSVFPVSWSPDGRFVFFLSRGMKTRSDIWVQPMFGDKKPFVLLNSSFDEQTPRLSPNGRWLAYISDETGGYEVYVQSFSADGKLGPDKIRVSAAGGKLPVWRRDGNELFFIAADGSMMSATVKTGESEFKFDTPKPLFKTRTLALEGSIFNAYDVTPDGNRFVIGTLVGESKAPPPTVIVNWMAEIKK